MKQNKIPIFFTEILINPYKGIYKKTTFYNDGSSKVELIPKGPIIMPTPIARF